MSLSAPGKLLVTMALAPWIGNCSETKTATEFCLDGEFDLGARYQGMHAAAGETYPTRFCYVTDDVGDRVMFVARGNSNPDMRDDWTVAFFPPDKVRIVNRHSPPDIEFAGKSIIDEALRYRRVDPRQLAAEIKARPEWIKHQSNDGWHTVQYPGSTEETRVLLVDGLVRELRVLTDIPLRGRVPVAWRWDWSNGDAPQLAMLVEQDLVFAATAAWRTLGTAETDALWTLSGEQEAVQVPGERWPARINLEMHPVAEGVHLVSGVRTGFSHIVIETASGLVVGDAPAGWVELQQLPPADLVPGLSISGLSENFIDFLGQQFPDAPIRAVAITHAHDDHSGGARAFAAAGAEIYAPQRITAFLNQAMNRETMPDDRLGAQNGTVSVMPVENRQTLTDDANAVELVVLPRGPHVDTALGIWATDAGVFFQSDLHVPRSEDDEPRTNRAATECWFASWAVANLPPDTIVLNSHSTPRTPVSRLARYLDSEVCRETQD